jgi:hypothetical protein
VLAGCRGPPRLENIWTRSHYIYRLDRWTAPMPAPTVWLDEGMLSLRPAVDCLAIVEIRPLKVQAQDIQRAGRVRRASLLFNGNVWSAPYRRKIHTVGPEFASWPSSQDFKRPSYRLKLGPKSGPTL